LAAQKWAAFSLLGEDRMRIGEFIRNEDGLTTVEWVMLCAVCMLAALGISIMVLQGADDLGSAVANQRSEAADDVVP
jgi:Flp pilus assembly pilin Flp